MTDRHAWRHETRFPAFQAQPVPLLSPRSKQTSSPEPVSHWEKRGRDRRRDTSAACRLSDRGAAFTI